MVKTANLVPAGLYPSAVPNWINGQERPAISGQLFNKVNPAEGKLLCRVARSGPDDVNIAVDGARHARSAWSQMTPVMRGEVLHDIAMRLRTHRHEVARIVALETGKSYKSALGETDGAISLGLFMAGEGQRLYGRTTTSGTSNRYAMTIREPLGIAGLITAANTPIANVAWKVFPALVCGNSAILKPAEDTPLTAWMFGKIAHEAGLPPGALNIVQGFGEEAGAPLVTNTHVDVISFTGSTAVGREIAVRAAERLARVSLELGGKNPLVVCDDADLDNAEKWVLLSAFSNAGQRCASGTRIIIFDSIYEHFRDRLVKHVKDLRVGPTDDDDFGPVINETQLKNMLEVVDRARHKGAVVLTGGERFTDADHRDGFYMMPTIIENARSNDEISVTELFGPIACLYRARHFEDALTLANDSPYGLTACIHTMSLHRAIQFTQKVRAGVTVVNAGTYGSEPHMPFGGIKDSGNGTREPGTEALDIYSNLKNIYLSIDPDQL